MSQARLEIAVRRAHPDDEEPDRLPLRWATVARLLAFQSQLPCACGPRARWRG